MRRTQLAIVAALILCGCGGGGSSSAGSVYAGDYAGSWHTSDQSQLGFINVHIESNGQMTGLLTGDTPQSDITGSISSNGSVAFTAKPDPASIGTEFSGSLALTGQQNVYHLAGTLTRSHIGDPDASVIFDMTRN